VSATQLALDLKVRAALGRDDFLVAPCNAAAVAWLDRWPAWPRPGLVVFGPPGCGKSHLVEVWQARSGARRLGGDRVDEIDPPALADRPLAIDGAEAWIGQPGPEELLLHLYNLLRESGQALLLTANQAPARWSTRLADLASRLNALDQVGVGAPDDVLLGAVLAKQFRDRQLAVDARVVRYLVVRMDRSFAAVRRLVQALDKTALAEGGAITRALAGRVLAEQATKQGETI